MWDRLPYFFMDLFAKYFRLEIIGAENIPLKGPLIVAPNHSGFLALDAMMLSHNLTKIRGEIPAVMTHKLWFANSLSTKLVEKFGFVEATKQNGIDKLENQGAVVLFPEGELGNFKPSLKAYHLQEFKRGFVRMALNTGSPILPTLIVGAEETHINLAQLRLPKKLMAPLPLNIIPLPARWKMVFLKPIYLPYGPEAANDRELVKEISEDLRDQMQTTLTDLVSKRTSVYL